MEYIIIFSQIRQRYYFTFQKNCLLQIEQSLNLSTRFSFENFTNLLRTKIHLNFKLLFYSRDEKKAGITLFYTKGFVANTFRKNTSFRTNLTVIQNSLQITAENLKLLRKRKVSEFLRLFKITSKI